MPHDHHDHVVQIFIDEHHKAVDCHHDHCHVGEFVGGHTGYRNAHEHDHEEHHPPHQPAPHGYHWAFNPSHWDTWHNGHGHNFHAAEWVLHHEHH